MSNEKILIVEDDKHISRLVKYNLDKAGFESIIAATGEKGLEILNKELIALIILDIMLPKMNGLEVCRRIKQDKKNALIPIIILTAKSEEIDRVVGFEVGADDYVVKPFSPRELVLRVKAILKRKLIPEAVKDILKFNELIIDFGRHKVIVNKKEIELTPMEFKLLVTLVQRRGNVQSRDTLLDDVWGITSEIYTRTIDVHIKRLRKKLGKTGKYIETVRGLGYRFSEEG